MIDNAIVFEGKNLERYLYDGVHPTEDGHALIAENILTNLARFIQ